MSAWDAALNPPPPPVYQYDGQVAISVRYLTGTSTERRPWVEGVDAEAERKIGVLISLQPILGGELIERTILVSNPDWRDYTLPSVYKCQGLTPGAPLPPGVQNPLENLNGKYVHISLKPRDVKFRDGRTVTMRSLIFEHVYQSQAECWETATRAAGVANAPVQPAPAKNGQVPSPTPMAATAPAPQQVQQPLPVASSNVIHALPDGSWIVLWQSGKSKLATTQEEAELVAAGPEPQP